MIFAGWPGHFRGQPSFSPTGAEGSRCSRRIRDVRNDLANVVYDTAASPLVCDDQIWRRALDVVPAGKVIFGSDYPLVLYPKTEREPGWNEILAEIGRAGLSAVEKTRLLAGNVARLLRL